MTRKRQHLLTPAVGVVLVVAALTSAAMFADALTDAYRKVTAPAAAPAAPERTYAVAGRIRLTAGRFTPHADGCRSTAFGADAQVVATDEHGRALAYAPVGAGQVVNGACEVPFTVAVPAGRGRYGLDIPWWGVATYTEQELAGDVIERTYG